MVTPSNLKLVLLDGSPVWKMRCPICGTWGYIDDDQFHGRVSVQCEAQGCTFHETISQAVAAHISWEIKKGVGSDTAGV